jgi:hypothetical protein
LERHWWDCGGRAGEGTGWSVKENRGGTGVVGGGLEMEGHKSGCGYLVLRGLQHRPRKASYSEPSSSCRHLCYDRGQVHRSGHVWSRPSVVCDLAWVPWASHRGDNSGKSPRPALLPQPRAVRQDLFTLLAKPPKSFCTAGHRGSHL